MATAHIESTRRFRVDLKLLLLAFAMSASACASKSPVRKDAAPAPVAGSAEAAAEAVDPSSTADPKPDPKPDPEKENFAARKPSQPPPRADEEGDCDHVGEGGVISATQSVLEEATCNSALWLDGLVGKEGGNLKAARSTEGYVETQYSYSEFFGGDTRIRARVNLELPSWEKRLSAFVGRDDEREFISDRTEKFALQSDFADVGDHDQWLAGLGYSLGSSDEYQTNASIGVASVRHPRLFVQGRGVVDLYSDRRNLFNVRSTLFWDTRRGFGVTAGGDYYRLLRKRLLFRFKNTGTVSEKKTEGLDWLSAAILYKSFGQARVLSGQSFIRGRTDADEPLREYGFRATLQIPLIKNQLIGETLAGYSWPRTDPDKSRDGSYLVGVGLKLHFGKDGDKE